MRASPTRRIDQNRQTRAALLRAALRVVSRHGIAGASVQRITEACGIGQGSLYTHFSSHRELLEELLPHEGILLLRALGRSVDRTAGFFENERRTFEALFEYLRRKPYFLRLLTEAEIATPHGYLQHARNIEDRYLRALQRARDAGEVRALPDEAYRMISGVLSSSRGYIGIGLCAHDARRLFHPPPIEPWVSATYVRFVRHGLGCADRPRAAQRSPAAHGIASKPAPGEACTDTRTRILEAAARRMHRDGYPGTTVSGICSEAGIAVGTFYGHFGSRREMFDALIDHVRRRMQAAVHAATAGSRDVLELEHRSFDAFFEHLRANPWFTRIETAAAVWAPQTYIRHFREIAADWVAALRSFRGRGELRIYEDRELEVLAWILMTARHHLATRFLLDGEDIRELPADVRAAWFDFVGSGLAPEGSARVKRACRAADRTLSPQS